MSLPSRPFVAEASYPPTYRSPEMDQIMRAVRSRHSVLVCGLGGSGKSHLLRFLAFHPHVPDRIGAPDVLRLYLDCNAAITDDAAGVFRALLLEAGAATDLPNSATDLLATLRTTLAARMTATLRILIVIDRFERIPATVQPAVLDGLRHLRDYLDRRVSYVLGSRTPPPIAEISEEFDDLLAAPAVVWVGALDDQDVAWNVPAVLREVGATADDATIQRLADLSGGHPRLLRAITLAWADEPIDNADQLRTQLLHNRQVARICEAIVRELDEPLQTVLQQIAQHEPISPTPRHPLRNYGLIHDVGDHTRLRSTVLEHYFRTRQAAPTLDLTALEQRLWDVVREQPGQIVRRDDLVTLLYGDNPDGINDEALTALVARLRRKLHQAQWGTLEAVRGLGYRFSPAVDTGDQQ